MFSDCCQAEDNPRNRYRDSSKDKSQTLPKHKVNRQSLNNEKHSITEQQSESESEQLEYKETPLKIKLLNATGLSSFIVDKFVFARPNSCYTFQTQQIPSRFHFTSTTFKFIPGYQTTCAVIESQHHLIPVVHFRKMPQTQFSQNKQHTKIINSGLTMIFSHGNSSNLELSFQIAEMILKKFPINFIVYDYTGYGNGCKKHETFNQKQHRLSDNSICSDLMQVIEWSQVPTSKLILWGYSLGCHPSIFAAAQLKVNALILQSPFASLYNMVNGIFPEQYTSDIFNNLEIIGQIKCDCMLIHSQDDDLIPVEHSKLLVKKFHQSNNVKQMRFIEIGNIKHSEMPLLFCVKKTNLLQEQLNKYLLSKASNLMHEPLPKNPQMKKKLIQLNGSLESLEDKLLFQINEELSQMSPSVQSSVKNIEFEMRQQKKRYFHSISRKNNLSPSRKSMALPTNDTEVSDEILLSEKDKHHTKLNFFHHQTLSNNALKTKKLPYFQQ